MTAKLTHSNESCNGAGYKIIKKIYFDTDNQGSVCTNSELPLDKLAQLGTNNDFEVVALTDIADKKTLLKRARRKYFSNNLAIKLANVSKHNPYSVLHKSYWNSYHCSSVLLQHSSGKVTGKYCKSRWCMVCNAIRTAVSIKKYSPTLDSWDDMHFVTLTQRTVPFESLSSQMDDMQYLFKSICEYVKRKHQRKQLSFKLCGLRKLECTYRPHSDHYHPHYHVIVQTGEMARMLHDEWLKRNCNALPSGQDVRKADKGSYQELFKYMTKVVSKVSENGSNRVIRADALDNIFNCFRGRRVLQNFGFRLPKSDAEIGISDVNEDEVIAILEWQDEATDWVDVDTGECVTGYVPTDGLRNLLK